MLPENPDVNKKIFRHKSCLSMVEVTKGDAFETEDWKVSELHTNNAAQFCEPFEIYKLATVYYDFLFE